MSYRVTIRLFFVTLLAGLTVLLVTSIIESQPSYAQGPAQTPAKRCEISFPLPNPSDIGVKKFEKRGA